jgi:lysophospholipase L1-like esterase
VKRILSCINHFLLIISLGILVGCDSGGGDEPPDIGDNNADVVVAIGDSITNGVCNPAGAPYPARVASATGKTVINAGTCGEKSAGGASRVGGLLAKHKPGTLLVLYGANDVILGTSADQTIENLRVIIQAAKGNQTRVIVGNLMPMYDSHEPFQPIGAALSLRINQLAKDEGVRLVNLAREFGQNRDIIQADGLHPTDAGTTILAAIFTDRL